MPGADAPPGEIDGAGSRIVQVDRTTGLVRTISGAGQATALVLVRDGGRTAGVVTVVEGAASVAQVTDALLARPRKAEGVHAAPSQA
ncbi:MAG: hypothetical protein ACFN04_09510 [Propionibacterium acidifaciens]